MKKKLLIFLMLGAMAMPIAACNKGAEDTYPVSESTQDGAYTIDTLPFSFDYGNGNIIFEEASITNSSNCVEANLTFDLSALSDEEQFRITKNPFGTNDLLINVLIEEKTETQNGIRLELESTNYSENKYNLCYTGLEDAYNIKYYTGKGVIIDIELSQNTQYNLYTFRTQIPAPESTSEVSIETEAESELAPLVETELTDFLECPQFSSEKNTSAMVDEIALTAKTYADILSDEQADQIIEKISTANHQFYGSPEEMEKFMWYGYLLDYKYDDTDSRSMLGTDLCQAIKYVYRNIETALDESTQENLLQLDKDLTELGVIQEETEVLSTEIETEYVEKVWIPNSGSKYHSKSSCSNMESPTQVSKSEAEQMGYTPCKRCY